MLHLRSLTGSEYACSIYSSNVDLVTSAAIVVLPYNT